MTLRPWKQTIRIPGISRPERPIMSNTFFSASSPYFLFGSPLNCEQIEDTSAMTLQHKQNWDSLPGWDKEACSIFIHWLHSHKPTNRLKRMTTPNPVLLSSRMIFFLKVWMSKVVRLGVKPNFYWIPTYLPFVIVIHPLDFLLKMHFVKNLHVWNFPTIPMVSWRAIQKILTNLP